LVALEQYPSPPINNRRRRIIIGGGGYSLFEGAPASHNDFHEEGVDTRESLGCP
jgi:hypothetical protein